MGVALIFFQIWFIKKWLGVAGVWVSPVIATKAKRQTHEYPQTLSNL